jgi:hypothetical protein
VFAALGLLLAACTHKPSPASTASRNIPILKRAKAEYAKLQ